MKAITLYQPWAEAIIQGYKLIETRTHDKLRSLEGEVIAIHAGQKFDESFMRAARAYLDRDLIHKLCVRGRRHRGVVLGTAHVRICQRLEDSDSTYALCPASGLYGLYLDTIKKLHMPYVVRGHQGIWHVEIPEHHDMELVVGRRFADADRRGQISLDIEDRP